MGQRVGRPTVAEEKKLITVSVGLAREDVDKLEKLAKKYRLLRSQLIAMYLGQVLDEEEE
jgi:uncharacterized protein (DUF3084 family)